MIEGAYTLVELHAGVVRIEFPFVKGAETGSAVCLA